MKKYKMIKLWAAALMVSSSGVIALGLVSCGTNQNPSGNTSNWQWFKAGAGAESAISIVNAATPDAWKTNLLSSQLSISNFKANDDSLSITLDITRTWNGSDRLLVAVATFQIVCVDDIYYRVNDWTIKSLPRWSPWTVFEGKALSETANNLIYELKPWTDDNINNKGLKWTYGVRKQQVWNFNDQNKAEWDIYGGDGANDPYKGMGGKPIIDQKAKTVTVIISKQGKNGAYDSDPIKAVIKYQLDTKYDISNWKFSKVEQQQSYTRIKRLFDAQDILAYSADKFETLFNAKNWMTIRLFNDNRGIEHPRNYHILDTLKNHYTIDKNFEVKTRDGAQEPTASGNDMLQAKIVFSLVNVWIPAISDYHGFGLSLYFNFYFANGHNIDDGLTPFNYTWQGVMHDRG